jgi:hypothetical protein
MKKKLKNIGFSSDEKSPKKSYYKIYGILLDIRLLMNHHSKTNKLIKDLKNVILN